MTDRKEPRKGPGKPKPGTKPQSKPGKPDPKPFEPVKNPNPDKVLGYIKAKRD